MSPRDYHGDLRAEIMAAQYAARIWLRIISIAGAAFIVWWHL